MSLNIQDITDRNGYFDNIAFLIETDTAQTDAEVAKKLQAPELYKKCGYEVEFIRENKKDPKITKYFIEGNYTSAVGLPTHKLYDIIKEYI